MLDKFLREIVTIVAGKQSEEIAGLIHSNKHVNEFLIAKKLDLTINQTRNILYKIADQGLVSSIRKKDKRKGWYTYFWKLEILKSLEFLKSVLTSKMNQLQSQVTSRSTKQFYMCERCNREFNEENALLHDFLCNECGGIFSLKDNTKDLKDLKKELEKLGRDLSFVGEEIAKEENKINKKREREHKKLAKEKSDKRKKTMAERAALRKKLAKKEGKNKPVKKKKILKKKAAKKKPVKKKVIKKKLAKKKITKKPIKKKAAKKKPSKKILKKKPTKKKLVKNVKKLVKKAIKKKPSKKKK
jgi:transcription factor E